MARARKPCRYCGTELLQASGGSVWRDETGKSKCEAAPPQIGIHRISNALSPHLKKNIGK